MALVSVSRVHVWVFVWKMVGEASYDGKRVCEARKRIGGIKLTLKHRCRIINSFNSIGALRWYNLHARTATTSHRRPDQCELIRIHVCNNIILYITALHHVLYMRRWLNCAHKFYTISNGIYRGPPTFFFLYTHPL